MQNVISLYIDVKTQTLTLMQGNNKLISYPVSTAANGVGEQMGSECTPRGDHIIRAKIGEGCEIYTVFQGRRPTGEQYSPILAAQHPQRDWILSRILWLSGKEPGKNRLGNVDTMRRYVYIHGAPDDQIKGTPSSHGCIRMHNQDVIDLFARVTVGTHVFIAE